MTKQQQVIARLKQQSVLILGAGLSGLSCLEFLHAQKVTCALNDSRENAVDREQFAKQYPEVNLSLGAWNNELIANADVVIISPGIDPNAPELVNTLQQHDNVIGDIELFCQMVDAPIVAVTGSNGKSTVVSALAHVGQTLGHNVVLGGNVGLPILSQMADDVDCYILELSSFQLETVKSLRARAASVLNVSDDHLDRHQTIENYAAVKQRIYQGCELAVTNADDPLTKVKSEQKQVSFGGINSVADYVIAQDENEFKLVVNGEPIALLSELPLAGIHNGLNYLAVLALGNALGWKSSDMLPYLKTFKGLAHRCQVVDTDDGVLWINDSKATNVGATVAAIEGIGPTIGKENRLIVIAGGDGKGADFSPLKLLFQQYVSQLIVLGKDASLIAPLAASAIRVETLEQAVDLAKGTVSPGDVVLLSPACASIDMFKNFAERGDRFASAACASEKRV
ncbi:UDP-N-acetylmuramoyl-L-alanine--D-glutamate ligase [Thalassotalea fusca]